MNKELPQYQEQKNKLTSTPYDLLSTITYSNKPKKNDLVCMLIPIRKSITARKEDLRVGFTTMRVSIRARKRSFQT